MDEAKFSDTVMGLVNSITTPLLSALILTDNLINEEIDNHDFYGKIMSIDEQLQSSVEYFLELRTITFNKYASNIIKHKNKYNIGKIIKELIYIILIIVNLYTIFIQINTWGT